MSNKLSNNNISPKSGKRYLLPSIYGRGWGVGLLLLSLFTMSQAEGHNSVITIPQVTESVTLTDDVDYVITDATPFTTTGSVNIQNTDHAVVIIKSIKPSKVISSWLKTHVFINGEQAADGTNCQVKMYASGAIILPYAKNIKPLTVYSEQNYGGESCNDFGLENSDGYMNTLTDAKLNNKIRSFKLKRGYMVTFSTRKEGRGYSRCFIADKEDLEISTLPAILDKTISSYRVFVWQNAKKAGLASDTRKEANAAVNSSWCYTWGVGENMLPDFECVPNHIKEDWPTSRECGRVTYSCHMKTNNEPGNSADDTPQDVATVLANWENLMRTGMRLCSESSHDGSMGHLKAFIDSIDARGWRCDLLDLHCYWPTDKFNNLNWYSSYYGNGRPIWISEWVWGASWSNNGAFAVSNRDDYKGNWQNNYNGTKPILEVLNANSKVERYAFWNSEANCSKIYLDGQLSTLGEYYATMGDDLGYNPANEYIPKNPPMKAPTELKAFYDKNTHQVTLRWHEMNGEYNQYCYLYEAYFKSPVYVDSDFYIFGSTNSNVRLGHGSSLWQYVPTEYVDIMDYSDYVLNNNDSGCTLNNFYQDIIHDECIPQGGYVGINDGPLSTLGWYSPWPDSPWGYYLAIVDQWDLEAVPDSAEHGEVIGGGRWPDESYDTIEAIPAPGYHFYMWSDGVTENPRVIYLTSDTSFTAIFYSNELYSLQVSSSDPAEGTVTGG